MMGEFARRDLGPTQEMDRPAVPSRQTAGERREARAAAAAARVATEPTGVEARQASPLLLIELSRAIDALRSEIGRRLDHFEAKMEGWERYHDGLHQALADDSRERQVALEGRLTRLEGGSGRSMTEQVHALRVEFARWKTAGALLLAVVLGLLSLGQLVAQVWAARPPIP